jgi:hypothetical protein
MESRHREIFETSVVIGGNFGTLCALTGYILAGAWDWSGRFCKTVVTDYLIPNLDFSVEYEAFSDNLTANFTHSLTEMKEYWLPRIRYLVKPLNMDIYGIAGIFERKLNASVIEFKNETIVFIHQQSQSALLLLCTSTLSIKNVTQFCYFAGTFFGISAALAYQYWDHTRPGLPAIEDQETNSESQRHASQSDTAANAPEQAINTNNATPAYTPSATLFANLERVSRSTSKRMLPDELRKTTKELTRCSKEDSTGEIKLSNPH